jgi:hypothetical protein
LGRIGEGYLRRIKEDARVFLGVFAQSGFPLRRVLILGKCKTQAKRRRNK